MARPANTYRRARRDLARKFRVMWRAAQREITPWSGDPGLRNQAKLDKRERRAPK